MPIYEFDCTVCSEEFEELVFGNVAIKEVTCPECGSHKVVKKISTFASRVAGGNSFSLTNSASSCSPGGT